MVPKVGLEPTRHHWRQILSLVRLPFRHFGTQGIGPGAGRLPLGTIRIITILRPPPKIKFKRKKSEEKAVRNGVPDAPPACPEDGRKSGGRGRGQKRSARSFTTAFFTREGASAAHFAKCSSVGKSSTKRPGVMALSVIIFCAW